MRCFKCRAEPMGICQFCGRAVCEDCHGPMPFILTIFTGRNDIPKAVVTADALWCGTCRPQPEPIPMPELY
ncbi:MAG: hypothetical protein ACH37Z_14405 [Anaerolineae bacterium]|jgi:hypothetical protein|nr:hypothetical protein [Ardenticatenia bacterium]MBK8540779.1 hypothetical protein [Ardenticatenia bacterium]HQZ71780.1 hypothetical protein [Anaerolineae bacterium]HRA20042.1 hypothetical protein [Anaerolineae bacterium]